MHGPIRRATISSSSAGSSRPWSALRLSCRTHSWQRPLVDDAPSPPRAELSKRPTFLVSGYCYFDSNHPAFAHSVLLTFNCPYSSLGSTKMQWPWNWRSAAASTEGASASAATTPRRGSSRKTFLLGIKLLHDCENSVVDIIFIHGLTGDCHKTWRAKSATSPWPQTLLSSELPNTRIPTFGHDAYVTDWRGMVSKNRIGNHAMNLLAAVTAYREKDDTNDRPIIFVCHSLGGLVCEDVGLFDIL